jgi:hypothetical protein
LAHIWHNNNDNGDDDDNTKNNGNDDGDDDDDDDDGIEGTDARHIGRAIDFAIASSLSLAVASICLFVAAAPVLASAALFCSCISICRVKLEVSKLYSASRRLFSLAMAKQALACVAFCNCASFRQLYCSCVSICQPCQLCCNCVSICQFAPASGVLD